MEIPKVQYVVVDNTFKGMPRFVLKRMFSAGANYVATYSDRKVAESVAKVLNAEVDKELP